MMRRLIIISARCVLTINAGCASKSGNGSAADEAVPAAQSIPADSPLSKIKVGMTAQEVSNILGMPTNQVSYASGKAFIPFYYGDDARRTEWSYKGMGRVVFAGGNIFGGGGGRVNRIDYDPSETGVRVQ
jgi:outer membrane protein assembly factor BamE (lipoprotein component of BamABCDE complex)